MHWIAYLPLALSHLPPSLIPPPPPHLVEGEVPLVHRAASALVPSKEFAVLQGPSTHRNVIVALMNVCCGARPGTCGRGVRQEGQWNEECDKSEGGRETGVAARQNPDTDMLLITTPMQ